MSDQKTIQLNQSEIERAYCIFTIICIQLFFSSEVYSHFPKDEWVLVLKALVEVCEIIIFRVLLNGQLRTVMLTLSTLILFSRCAIIYPYFFNGDFYKWVNASLVQVFFEHALYLMGFVTLCWGQWVAGRFEIADLPLRNWRTPSPKPFLINLSFFILFFVLAVEFVVLFKVYSIPWIDLVPATLGIVIIFVKANDHKNAIKRQNKKILDQAEKIQLYENAIEGFVSELPEENKMNRHQLGGSTELRMVVDNTKKEASNNEN
jgi:hypothetical protein